MKKTTQRTIIIKLLKISDKEAILKSAGEAHVYKDKEDSRFFVGNNAREKRMEKIPFKY